MTVEERASDYEKCVKEIATTILDGSCTSHKNLSFQLQRYTAKKKDANVTTPKAEVILTRVKTLLNLLIDCSVPKIGSLTAAAREADGPE